MATEEVFTPEKTQELSAEKEEMEDETIPNDAESNKAKIPDSGNGCQMMEHEGVTKPVDPVAEEKQVITDIEVSVEPLPPHDAESSDEIESEDSKINKDAVEESVTSLDVHKEDSEEFVDAVNALPEKDEITENEVIEEVLQKEQAFVCGAEKQTDEHGVATAIMAESESEDDQSDEENCLEAVGNESESKDMKCPENYDSENLAEGDVEVSETLCDGPEEIPEASVEMESSQTKEDQIPDESPQEDVNETENLICEKLANMKMEEEPKCKEGGDEVPVTEVKDAATDPEQQVEGTEIPEQDSDTVDSPEDAAE